MKINFRGVLPGILGFLLLCLILFGILPGFLIYGISLVFAYGSAKWGERKTSIINFLLFLLLSSFVFGFSISLLEIYLLALFGTLLGQGIYAGRSASEIFVPTTILLYGIMLLMIFLQRKYLGMDILSTMEELYLQQLSDGIRDARFIAELKVVLQEYGVTLLFLVAVLLNLFISWTLQGLLSINRVSSQFQLENYRLGKIGFLQLGGLFLLAYLGAGSVGKNPQTAVFSILIFLLAFYFVQGISLLIYVLKQRGRNRILQVMMVFFATILPFAQIVLVVIGIIDQFRDFRKLEQSS